MEKYGTHFSDSYLNYCNLLLQVNNLEYALNIIDKFLFVNSNK